MQVNGIGLEGVYASLTDDVAQYVELIKREVESGVNEAARFVKKYLLPMQQPRFLMLPGALNLAWNALTDDGKNDLERELPAKDIRKLNLLHYSGEVNVVGTNDDKISIAAKNKDVGFTCKTKIKTSGEEMEIRTDKSSFDPSACKVDLTVFLPMRTAVNGKVLKGHLNMTDIAGAIAATVGVGTFDASTSSDNVKVEVGVGHLNLHWTKVPKKGSAEITSGLADSVVEFPQGTTIDAMIESGMGHVTNSVRNSADAGMKFKAKVGVARLDVRYTDEKTR